MHGDVFAQHGSSGVVGLREHHSQQGQVASSKPISIEPRTFASMVIVGTATEAKNSAKLEHCSTVLRLRSSRSQPALQDDMLWSPHLVQQTAGVDHVWPALVQRRDTQQAHARLQLLSQHCDRLASKLPDISHTHHQRNARHPSCHTLQARTGMACLHRPLLHLDIAL